MKKFIGIACLLLLMAGSVKAQFTYGTTGLLHMPTADMQRDKTFMAGSGFLDKHSTPYYWNYHTYNYYINITFLPWVEVSYTCTLLTARHLGIEQFGYSGYTNQDRSFHGRLRLWKEGWWKEWTPQIVAGVNDFTTGAGVDYSEMAVEGDGNGFFNRYYIAATKHLSWFGEWGVHAAYVYNKRYIDKLNGVAFGVDYQFDLPETSFIHKAINGLNLMAEYDSKFMNIGARYTLWKDHINIIGELRECKYPSIGMYFKVHLK
ncbi:MAG: YjbH domain-containing protein [Bacteroides sp.]|nr:YjbH domain-containing protein [Bacteroides sp.]